MRLATGTTLAAAAWTAPGLAPHAAPVARALGIARRLPAGRRGVLLTFDDGPHPEGTPAILEALRDRRAAATFFLVGEQVERWPGLAAEIAAAGHAVAIHGHRHRNVMRVAPRALERDLERAAFVIGAAAGALAPLYRPPYGIFTPAALLSARRRAWTPLLWSRWGADWRRRATPASITRRVAADAVEGDVLLLHDADHYSAPGSHRRTAAAMPHVLDALAARGLEPVAWRAG